ncbi:unnamed protein product [Somion occarium]|uniref:DUF221-domain-containing protein n=1 Tax=Somion occarium TaxID=3059160 RepID=A0ABP1E3Q6_9APHY
MASQVYLQGYLQLVRRSDYLSISELTCFEGSYEGPWFQTQLIISFAVGVTSFLIFSYCRTRWPLLFAPRTKLKGTFLTQRGTQYDLFYPSAFSPHEAHVHQAFFGWVIPTIRISEFTVLQIVGLDAAVLLNFYKMAFTLFSVCSLFAAAILMPVNLRNNIDIGDGSDDTDSDWPSVSPESPEQPQPPPRDWLDLISDANSYLSVHLVFTYLFTILTLYYINRNYRRFIRARQLFSLELVHSIPARTVMVTQLPPHLRSEKALAEYFESMDMSVESVNVCRQVGSLDKLLKRRTEALIKLEATWVKYLGNPADVESNGSINRETSPLVDLDVPDMEDQRKRLVVPHRPRPTIRPNWLGPKVDALEYLEEEFKKADEAVQKRRRLGKFKPTQTAFVTFEKMSSAQIAVQTAHASAPEQCITYAAPEARDIVWSSMGYSLQHKRVREVFVLCAMLLLLFFWVFPVSALASLLSYKEIKKTMPWLGRLIDSNPKIQAIVQNSLPSVGIITLNAILPFFLEALTYTEGYPARSWIEYSLLKKYFLFLLTSVVFVFLLASTYWQLVRDLANTPAKIPEKLAAALQQGRARHFFLSYVILQGIGIMPLQLLNLGVLVPRMFYRIFITRTPRDYAELNAPPMINYGVVYPQAILIFVITLLYSVIQPLIVVFGAVYFGVGYVVYKYKLLFVFYKPYESQGQAWPITFIRVIWGVVIFQVFMTGIFILRKSFILSSLLTPLIFATMIWSWYTYKKFKPLSKYVSLSSVSEVQRGEDSAEVVRLRSGHPVTWSQSYLNRRRYAQNDETLYVAPEDERTDYSQPPMANWYSGVLNTGKRRYGHPALTGVLPQPWLPLKKGQSMTNGRLGDEEGGAQDTKPVVLTLRKRYSIARQPPTTRTENDLASVGVNGNPWEDNAPGPSTRPIAHAINHRLSFDAASGVIMLPDSGDWLEGDSSDSEEDYGAQSPVPDASSQDAALQEAWAGESSTSVSQSPNKRYTTYFHHPERRKRT